jgi:type II secretory pathway component GspD/PulD (secretin)
MGGGVSYVCGRGRARGVVAGYSCWKWTCAVVIAASVLVASGHAADAQYPGTLLDFNIPSQPLETALNRYGDATGREALYDTSLASGRVSGNLQGKFTANDALERLLSGTGLSARFVAETSFVVLPAPPANRQIGLQAPLPAQRHYYGLIQDNLLAALCRSSVARPGHYRIVAMFWIGPTGAIEKSRRIGSAGTADVDQQIDAALRSVKFSEPPPAGFEQPVLILIVPQAPGVTPPCASDLHPVGMAP